MMTKPITTVSQGQWAENLAHNYLCQQGLKPIERNFRCKIGEIDLIFLDKTILAFIEVRYRKNSSVYGGSLESINFRKQQRIIKTATYYLQTHKWAQQFSCRFDAVLISGNTTNPQLSWISDAFRI
jgi:putative endonuclease